MLFLVIALLIVAGAAVAITAIRVHGRRRTAKSRHAALRDIAAGAPHGTKLTAFEQGAQTWVEIGPPNEVPCRGRR